MARTAFVASRSLAGHRIRPPVTGRGCSSVRSVEASWLTYQRQVADLLRLRVGSDATVEHDVRLIGRSGRQRQIDVLIRYRIGNAVNGIVVVDAKQRGRKISIDGVEAFAGLVQDVKAHHGVLVASAGFQEGAIGRAEDYGNIDLQIVTEEDLGQWRPRLVHLACWECGLMTAFKYEPGESAPHVGAVIRPCPACEDGFLEVAAVADRGLDATARRS